MEEKVFKAISAEEKAKDKSEEDDTMKANCDYGWVIVIVAFACIFIPDGVLVAFGGFINSLQEDFSTDQSTLSLAASWMNGTKSLFGLVVSSLMSRYGFMKVGVGGGALYAAALSICAFTDNVAVFVLTFGVLGGMGAGMLFLPAVVLIGHYFNRQRALATTVARVGSPMGGFVLVPLSNYLIQNFGWRKAFSFLALIGFICPLLGLFMREPSDELIDEEDYDEDFQPPDHLLRGRRKSMFLDLPEQVSSRLASRTPSPTNPTAVLVPPSTNRRQSITPRRPNTLQREALTRSLKKRGNNKPPDIDIIVEDYDSGTLTSVTSTDPDIDEALAAVAEAVAKKTKRRRRRMLTRGSTVDSGGQGQGHEALIEHLRFRKEQMKEIAELQKDKIMESKIVSKLRPISLMKDPAFLLFCVANSLANASSFVPFVYLQDFLVRQKRMDVINGGIVISVIQLFNALGRLPLGWIVDHPKIEPIKTTLALYAASGFSVVAFTMAGSEMAPYVTMGVFYGLGNTFLSIQSLALIDILGLEDLPQAFGMLLFFEGMSKIIIPPLAGFIAGLFWGDLTVVLYTSAFGFYLAGVSCALSSVFNKYKKDQLAKLNRESQV